MQFFDRPFIRFLLTGGAAAGINVVSRAILSLALPFAVAVPIAYLFGMTTAFFLARKFVFERSGKSAHDEYIRFALVNVVALLQVWLVSVGLAELLFPALGFYFYAELIAHMIGVLSPAVTSYWGHKLFTFRKSGA